MDPFRPGGGLSRGLFLGACLLACGIHPASSEIWFIPDTLLGFVGDAHAMFIWNVSADAMNYTWYRGAGAAPNSMIVSYNVSSNAWTTGPGFSGRENVTTSGYLTFATLQLSDSGFYTVVVTAGNGCQKATGYLTVVEPEPKPELWVNSSTVVEYVDAVRAECRTNNTRVTWYVSLQEVSSNDRMTISADNRTLVIHSVRSDDISIQCRITSYQDRHIYSTNVMLLMNYGPYNVFLLTKPISIELGANVELQCSTITKPAPRYRWTHNGVPLPLSTAKITLPKVTQGDLGWYRCIVENPKTQLIMYRDHQLRVFGPIPQNPSSEGYLKGFLIGMAVLGGASLCVMLAYTLKNRPCSSTNRVTRVSTSDR